MRQITRRKFVELAAAGIATAPLALRARPMSGVITAQEAVDRIKKNLGVEWKPETVDTFKAGDPLTDITGIVTTALPTLSVLGRAVKSGANLIVTCEPTFFSKADTPTPPVRPRFVRGVDGRFVPVETRSAPPPPDAVFSAKANFIRKHNLVVWRFSDHWRLRTPDPYAQGLVEEFGWTRLASPNDPRHIAIPEISLDRLVLHVKKSLNSRGGMRVVGDPKVRIRSIALLPGTTPIQESLETLPEVDAIIAGEVREWESVEYVRDAVALGGKKALILVGRLVSEEPGMRVCAQWLKTIIPEVDAMPVSTGDPYWRPNA